MRSLPHQPPPPHAPRADMRALCQSPRKDGSPFLRARVWATATVYVRYFYRQQSFATADPRPIALAALLLASKVEEAPVHTRDLVAVAFNLVSADPARWHAPPTAEQVVSAEARIMVRRCHDAPTHGLQLIRELFWRS